LHRSTQLPLSPGTKPSHLAARAHDRALLDAPSHPL
jgi:hypothetical protein